MSLLCWIGVHKVRAPSVNQVKVCACVWCATDVVVIDDTMPKRVALKIVPLWLLFIRENHDYDYLRR